MAPYLHAEACLQSLEIRIGRLVDVQAFPVEPEPAYKMWIDFGEYGVRRACAPLARSYAAGDLFGRTVAAIMNLPPRDCAGFLTEALVLSVNDADGRPVLLAPDVNVPLGQRIG